MPSLHGVCVCVCGGGGGGGGEEAKFFHNVWVTWPRWQQCPYMVKTFENLKISEIEWPMTLTLVCSIRLRFYHLHLFKVDLDLFLQQGQIWLFGLLYGKKGKLNFSEAVVAYDIKVDICNHLELEGQSFIVDLCPGCFRFSIFIFSKTALLFERLWSLCWMGVWKFVNGFWVKWSRWPPCHYMVKIFSRTKCRTLNLVSTIRYPGSTKFIQMVTLGWPWSILWQGQIWSLRLCMRKRQN